MAESMIGEVIFMTPNFDPITRVKRLFNKRKFVDLSTSPGLQQGRVARVSEAPPRKISVLK